MSELLNISYNWKEKANKLLQEKDLVNDLSSFGAVHFTGSYSYNLMTRGDIDMVVSREQNYSASEVVEILKELYLKRKFKSYFILGDWDNPKKGNEFPNGHYIGLKDKVGTDRWKFDIWFLSNEEYARRNNNLELLSIDGIQKELILECKQYRDESNLEVSSQQIYDLVVRGICSSLEDFKKLCQKK